MLKAPAANRLTKRKWRVWRRLKGAKRAFLGTAIAGAALLSIATEPAKAGPIDVFVGYADNLRASGFFPNPWIGDPGVVTQSQTGQTFDSGAVRIDTSTGAALPFRTSRWS